MEWGRCQVAIKIAIMYNMYIMKIITTTNARKNISRLVNRVKYGGEMFGIGRRNSIDAILMRFPSAENDGLDEMTNMNANSASFDFLAKEPELYSLKDLKKRYA